MTFETGTIPETATKLIAIAKSGELTALMGGFSPANNEYSKRCWFFHRPTNTSISLTRNNMAGFYLIWHCSLAFTDGKKALPFDEAMAAEWLRAIYGKWTSQLTPLPGFSSPGIKHYWLRCPDRTTYIDLETDK